MIIFGTSGITSVEKKGIFHCPACGAGAAYQQKGVRRFFTLFFVPLIPLHKVADYVECGRCGGTFKPEVLSWNGAIPPSLPTGTPPPFPPATAAAIHPSMPPDQLGSTTTVSYQSNGVAKASMILGIVGLLTSFFVCPSVLFIILSFILGIVGLGNIRKGNGLVGGKGAAITGITCSAIGAIVMIAIVLTLKDRPAPSDRNPTRSLAASNVSGSSHTVAYGNSPKARELAEKYAIAMQMMHSASFASKKGGTRSSRYVVHCELHDNTCAFLASVPDYRKFDEDAKSTLASLSWSTAREVLKEDGTVKPDTQLCIALKGLVMFGSVMVGEVKGISPRVSSKKETDMDPFFPEPSEKPAVAPEKISIRKSTSAEEE